MPELVRWTDPLTESNCYLLGEDGYCIVVDPNDPVGPLARMDELGWTPEHFLLTHEHCDHMAGLTPLRARFPRAKTVCSAACSAGIQDSHLNMTRRMEVYLTYLGKPGVSYPPFVCAPAERTFESEWETVWRGHTLSFQALPGHTPGGAAILWDETILFSGDYLIPGQTVILRLPGGSAADYERVTRPWLAALPPGLQICPGHGDPYILSEKELRWHGL